MTRRSRRSLLCCVATTSVTTLAGCGFGQEGVLDGSSATDRRPAGSPTTDQRPDRSPATDQRSDGPAGWPMHRRDAANTAAAPAGSGPSQLSDVEELLRVSDSPIGVSPPVVSDDTVYATLGELYALTPDGDRRWSRGGGLTPALTGSGAVVDPGATIRLLSSDGESVLWEVDGLGANSPATVSEGSIYVGAGDHFLYAIDAASGTVQWRFATGDYVNATPAARNDTVYAGSEDGNLYALDAATGEEQWRFGPDDEAVDATAVGDGVVYATSGGNLYAIDAADGSERWRYGADQRVTAPAVTPGLVFVEGHPDAVVALDPADGAVAWERSVPAGGGSGPVVVGDCLYVSGNDLLVFEAESGGGSGLVGRNGYPWTSPVVARGTVYVSYGWHEYRTLYAVSDG